VVNGLWRLPELPPSLHPVEGDALLWNAGEDPAAAPDTAAAQTGRPARAPAATDGPPAGPPRTGALAGGEVRLEILCPGDFWIRGHGLDLEVAGDLTLGVREDRSVVSGQLEAKQGSLMFLGRFFDVDRGTVDFFPDEDASDPDLDVRLSTNVAGVTYLVEIHGRARNPRLTLSSEPPMSEADIVSSLLFGKPASDLDDGQEDVLKDRTQQILLTYGSKVMGDSISRGFGLDVVSFQEARGRHVGTALVVGKYLSPRAMVRYEKILEAKNAYYVTLELSVPEFWKLPTPGLKVELTSGEASGIDGKWSMDW
jgi:translocation and assembly module TamB